VFVATNNAT